MYVLAVHSSKSWIHRSVSSQHDTAVLLRWMNVILCLFPFGFCQCIKRKFRYYFFSSEETSTCNAIGNSYELKEMLWMSLPCHQLPLSFVYICLTVTQTFACRKRNYIASSKGKVHELWKQSLSTYLHANWSILRTRVKIFKRITYFRTKPNSTTPVPTSH